MKNCVTRAELENENNIEIIVTAMQLCLKSGCLYAFPRYVVRQNKGMSLRSADHQSNEFYHISKWVHNFRFNSGLEQTISNNP